MGTKRSRQVQNKESKPNCLFQPAGLASLSALMACLLCFVPGMSTCFSKCCFVEATNINKKISGTHHELVFINVMPMDNTNIAVNICVVVPKLAKAGVLRCDSRDFCKCK